MDAGGPGTQSLNGATVTTISLQSHRSALFAAAFAALVFLAFAPRITREMPDLEVYWRAAQRARLAEPLYRLEDGHYQFKYLPAFAVLSIPLGLVTLPQAKTLWFAASLTLLCALIALSISLLPHKRRPTWVLIAAVVIAMGKFFGHELLLGQVNLLFAAVVTAALYGLKWRHDAAAGVLLALAVVVKPYAVLFLPWLAATRRTRAVIGAALGVVAIVALPVIVYGPEGTLALHGEWWGTVADSTAPNLLNQDNSSVAAMFAKWFGPGALAARLAAVTGFALVGTVVFVFRRRSGVAFPEGVEGALLLTLIPLLSPQGWDYVFLISTPAIVYLANYGDRLPGLLRVLTVVAIAAIGLSLFDVMGRANYAVFMSLSIITICYLVVVAALVVLRARTVA